MDSAAGDDYRRRHGRGGETDGLRCALVEVVVLLEGIHARGQAPWGAGAAAGALPGGGVWVGVQAVCACPQTAVAVLQRASGQHRGRGCGGAAGQGRGGGEDGAVHAAEAAADQQGHVLAHDGDLPHGGAVCRPAQARREGAGGVARRRQRHAGVRGGGAERQRALLRARLRADGEVEEVGDPLFGAALGVRRGPGAAAGGAAPDGGADRRRGPDVAHRPIPPGSVRPPGVDARAGAAHGARAGASRRRRADARGERVLPLLPLAGRLRQRGPLLAPQPRRR